MNAQLSQDFMEWEVQAALKQIAHLKAVCLFSFTKTIGLLLAVKLNNLFFHPLTLHLSLTL